MDKERVYTTFGEGFVFGVEKTETKGLLFAFLEDTVRKNYPQYKLADWVDRVSDFDSVAVYHSKLARIRIDYNAKAVQDIQQQLIALNNHLCEEDHKNKEKIVRKLNLLTNNYPSIDEVVYISMVVYISREYGCVKDFKNELKKYLS